MKKLFALLLALMMMGTVALAQAAPDTSRVADASEMTDVEDIVPEGMTPVLADSLNDGTYAVEVESSSSMFKITGCDLTVEDGQMTVLLHMKSEAYTYMYPGTAQQAAQAPLEDLAALQTLEGDSGEFYAFKLPLDALDSGYTCAAFSARKQAWYPRTLLFRADSLPLEAWRELTTAQSLALTDGSYTCGVTLAGGKTTVDSPAKVTVSGGEAVADIVFSTSKIDYVVVNGEKALPTNTEGNAAFTIPIVCFDRPVTIIVDSTAISPATETAYTITFDSASLKPLEG